MLKKYEEMNSLQIDALREIGSIGTGNAATALSSMLGIEVRIPLPEVQILEFNAAVEKLGGFETIAAGIISDSSWMQSTCCLGEPWVSKSKITAN